MASAALTAQINVRMSKDLKEKGDAGLSSLGVTPTEAIRRVWELAASGASGLKRVEELMSPSKDDAAVAANKRMQAVREGQSLFSANVSALGITHEELRKLHDGTIGEMPFDNPSEADKTMLVQALLAKHGDTGKA